MSNEEKIEEYIEDILFDDEFVIRKDDQNDTFSDGKKIADFFDKHSEEIVNRLFCDKHYKEKLEYFPVRSKIIDYIIERADLKKCSKAIENVLNYLNVIENKENMMRCICTDFTSHAHLSYQNGEKLYKDWENLNKEKRAKGKSKFYKEESAENLAKASEKYMKALLLYREFVKNEKYNYSPKSINELKQYRDKKNHGRQVNEVIGSTIWREKIADEDIKSIAEISKLIQENLTIQPVQDERYGLTEKKSSGHNLSLLHKYLDPTDKRIIDNIYYTNDDSENSQTKYAIIAILEGMIDYSNKETMRMREEIKKIEDIFVISRYASASGKIIKKEDFKTAKRFASSLHIYCGYLFPSEDEYEKICSDEIDFHKIDEYHNFEILDKVTKYYLATEFSNDETEALKEICEKIAHREKKDILKVDEYINLVIYFKHYIKNEVNVNYKFENTELHNILDYYDEVIENFDILKGQHDSIYEEYLTEEKIEEAQEILKSKQTVKKIFTEEEIRFLTEKQRSNDQTRDFIDTLIILKENGVDIRNIQSKDTIESILEKQGIEKETQKEIIEKVKDITNNLNIGMALNTQKRKNNIEKLKKRLNDTISEETEKRVFTDEEIQFLTEKQKSNDPIRDFIDILIILKENGVDIRNIQRKDTIESILEKQGVEKERQKEIIEKIKKITNNLNIGSALNTQKRRNIEKLKKGLKEEIGEKKFTDEEFQFLTEKQQGKKLTKQVVVEQKGKGELGENEKIEKEIFEETVIKTEDVSKGKEGEALWKD